MHHRDTEVTEKNREKREMIFLSACGSGPQAETGL